MLNNITPNGTSVPDILFSLAFFLSLRLLREMICIKFHIFIPLRGSAENCKVTSIVRFFLYWVKGESVNVLPNGKVALIRLLL